MIKDGNNLDEEFRDRAIAFLYSGVPFGIRLINNNIHDPFPGQSIDFRLAMQFSCYAMAIAGSKNKVIEFAATMSPAILGTIDEIFNVTGGIGLPHNVSDPKDIVAYYAGSMATYLGVYAIRTGVNIYQGIKKKCSTKKV